MAITATTAAVIAVGVAAAAGAGTSIAAGMAQKKQAEAQADIMEQQAKRERAIAVQKEDDFRKRQRRLAAAVRAAGGARGIEMDTGSPLLAAEDFAKETELMANRIREGGEVGATRVEQQADLTRYSGRQARDIGLMRGTASLFSGFNRGALILDEQ